MISTSPTEALAQSLDEVIPDAVVLGELSMVLEAAQDDGRAITLTDGETVHVPANADIVITTKAIFCERYEGAFPSGYCLGVDLTLTPFSELFGDPREFPMQLAG